LHWDEQLAFRQSSSAVRSLTPPAYWLSQPCSHAVSVFAQEERQLRRETHCAFAPHAESVVQHCDLSHVVQALSPAAAGHELAVLCPQLEEQELELQLVSALSGVTPSGY
jgi:hypothetical protein